MLWERVERIRAHAPLIHNITNFVVMNGTANALLALGASPVMAHALEEVEEMVALAAALVLNIGTLSSEWEAAMLAAGRVARARGIPIVLDPVGAGATTYRSAVALRLLSELRPAVLRANASEVRALASGGGGTKGVDSTCAPEASLEAAQSLTQRYGCVVSISGATDIVVLGSRLARVHNGHPLMTRVTGLGCAASALTGAFLAVEPDAFEAATDAMVVNGVAGELAVQTAIGPGSFHACFLDALYGLEEDDLERLCKVERP